MTNNIISTDKTITCPICGATAHGMVIKCDPATLVGCDICQPGLMEHISKHPNIDGNGYEYYAAERTPTDPDDYSLSTPYDEVCECADRLKLCPICGKPCDTIIIDDGMPIGCSHCAPEVEMPEGDTPDYDALEAMYLYGFDGPCRCRTEDYNRWHIAKHREEQIVTGKAGRPLIAGWDKDGRGELYDI